MSQNRKAKGLKRSKASKSAAKQRQPQQQEAIDEEGRDVPRPVPGTNAKRPVLLPSAAREHILLRQQGRQRGQGRGGKGLRRGAVESGMAEQLRRLQCPFLWRLPPRADSVGELYSLLDTTPHRPTPWHVAVQQIHFAYEFARFDKLWKSRELLEEVYTLLGEEGDDDDAAGLMGCYRAGLRHVLDACWLLVRADADARQGRAFPDGEPVADVCFDNLEASQRASVWAMRAIMAQGDAASAGVAVSLAPEEGQWLYVKGQSLRAARALKQRVSTDMLKPSYTDQERALFAAALERRKNPQTIMRMARCYAGDLPDKDDDDDDEDDDDDDDDKAAKAEVARCAQIVRSYVSEALDLYPDSPYVHLNSGHLYNLLDRDGAGGRGRDERLANICFLKALQLGRGWMRARLDYGLYCVSSGRLKEGARYLSEARKVFPNMRRNFCDVDDLFTFFI